MPLNEDYARILIKRSVFSGTTPTIPVDEPVVSADFEDLLPTDLLIGEMYMNVWDDRMWIRTLNGILEIPVSASTSLNTFTTGATLFNDTLFFDRNDQLSAYTVDLSSLIISGGTGNFLPLSGGTLTGSLSATTFFGDGSNLTGISTADNYVSGGTYNPSTEEIEFVGTNSATTFNVDVSALLDDTNTFTTGATLVGNNLVFDRNDVLSAYTVDLSSIAGGGGGNFLPLNITGATTVNFNQDLTFSGTGSFTDYNIEFQGTTDYSIHKFNLVQNSFEISDGTDLTSIIHNGGELSITNDSLAGGEFTEFKIGNRALIASSNWSGFTGIRYLADYSSNYTNRSLVDKEYVDNLAFSGASQNLQSVLNTGNETLGNDIILTSGDTIQAGSGAGELNLRDGFDDFVTLGNGFKRLELTTNQVNLVHSAQNAITMSNTDIILRNEAAGTIKMTTGSGSTFGEIQVVNSSGVNTTEDTDHFPVFISAKDAFIDNFIFNSAVIGGEGLSAFTSNTVYVPNLNINSIGTGTSINNLGIDIDGNVVIGSAGGTGVTGNFLPLSGGTITGNLDVIGDLTVSGTTNFNGPISFCISGATTTVQTDCSLNQILTGVTNSSIVAGSGNIINENLDGVFVAGTNLTATTSNTAYFSNVNINNVGTGTSVNNLGIDTNGNVVVGSSGGGVTLWTGGTGTNSVRHINTTLANTAGGNSAISVGEGSVASGDYSASFGQGNGATGFATAAFNSINTVSGSYSSVFGRAGLISGQYSLGVGNLTRIFGDFCFHSGSFNTIRGSFNSIFGSDVNTANGTSYNFLIGSSAGSNFECFGDYNFGHQQWTNAYSAGNDGFRSSYGVILGGRDNRIMTSSNYSSIISSSAVTVTAPRAIVIGLQSYTASTADTVYVPNLAVTKTFTPSSSGDTSGVIGQITWDDDYIYVKTNNGWGRTILDYNF